MGKFNFAKSAKKYLEMTQGIPEKKPERKRIATMCGHVTRRLKKNKPLTGDVLEFALNAARDDEIAEKLKMGEPLSDYEKHLMVDVCMLHMHLGQP